MPKQARSARIFHFAARWSVEHNDENWLQLRTWLKENSDKFIFQAEYTEKRDTQTGEIKGNPHYQIYFHTKEKKRVGQMINEIVESGDVPGLHISPASESKDGYKALSRYCMKEETRVAGPWADKKIYMGEDIWPEAKFPEWQKKLLAILRQPPDFRTMHWVYDGPGHNGKTAFLKFLVYKENAVGLGYGNSVDVLNLVSKMPGHNIYAWNLTRAKPANLSELDLYSAMESVKDGYFINLKYETRMVLMSRPHVVVFANHFPKLEHISADRWQLWEIRNGDLVFPEK